MLCAALLTGCGHTGDGNTTEPMQQETAVEETVGAAAESSRESVQDTGTQSAETPEAANVRTEQSMEEREEEESAAGNETAKRELTAEELQWFADFVNDGENYGFLLSQYERPEEVNLEEVLYNGAGMENAPFTEEERQAYESEGCFVDTDITNLSGTQIDAFLQKKMGISFAETKNGLDWFYFEGNDCYLFQHGDTNQTSFLCVSGRQEGDVIILQCKATEAYRSDCILTLKKAGDTYRFVSNIFEKGADSAAEPDESVWDGVEGDVRRQLEAFAQAGEQWSVQEYDDYTPVSYTVYDLDRDGRLELVTHFIMGTGLYSENHFYRMNESGDGITELPQIYYAEYAELDIGPGGDKKAFQDEKDGIIYYLDSDYTRNGAAEAWEAEGAFYLKDGQVYSLIYRSRHILADENGASQETFYDAEGNEVDRKAWEQLYADFCMGKAEVYGEMSWQTASVEDADVTEGQLLEKLVESYREGK